MGTAQVFQQIDLPLHAFCSRTGTGVQGLAAGIAAVLLTVFVFLMGMLVSTGTFLMMVLVVPVGVLVTAGTFFVMVSVFFVGMVMPAAAVIVVMFFGRKFFFF